jgi:predicted phosphodiesterase
MVRRVALFSDVHGNLPALEAVLADMDAAAVTDRYCLGDLVGYGPWPAEVVERVRSLAIPTVRGNYDDGVGHRRGGCGCYYATEQARADGAESYSFTDTALDYADHDWLAELPDDIRFEHDGVRVLLAHGSPRKINEYLLLDRTDVQLARLARDAAADVVCVGHVHIPYHRRLPAGEGTGLAHYVSSGSVGKPKDGDPRAAWVELMLGGEGDVAREAPDDPAASRVALTGTWAAVRVHRVPYDVDSVARAMARAGLPDRLAEALLSA